VAADGTWQQSSGPGSTGYGEKAFEDTGYDLGGLANLGTAHTKFKRVPLKS
jgi:hypothetical protein